MATYLEHNNVTVSDLDFSIEFFTHIFSDWKLRHRAYFDKERQDFEWAHVGTEISYLALQSTPYNQTFSRPISHYFDHYGIIVDNLEDVVSRLKKYPYRIRIEPEKPSYKKVYAYIFDGIILEILQYKTDNLSLRNKY